MITYPREMTKRFFDIILSGFLLLILSPAMIVVYIVVKVGSPGPAIYWSSRIGYKGVTFLMPKFRSMNIGTPAVATHLLSNPSNWLTPEGRLLRKLSLDELPQLWSIFRGDMSFVGPRPALFNQVDLIELRKQRGVDILIPGLTGLAQVSGRDELSIQMKVNLDVEYLNRRAFWFDIWIIIKTILQVIQGRGVTH